MLAVWQFLHLLYVQERNQQVDYHEQVYKEHKKKKRYLLYCMSPIFFSLARYQTNGSFLSIWTEPVAPGDPLRLGSKNIMLKPVHA